MRHHAKWALFSVIIFGLVLVPFASGVAATGGQTPQAQQDVQRLSSLLQQDQVEAALE